MIQASDAKRMSQESTENWTLLARIETKILDVAKTPTNQNSLKLEIIWPDRLNSEVSKALTDAGFKLNHQWAEGTAIHQTTIGWAY